MLPTTKHTGCRVLILSVLCTVGLLITNNVARAGQKKTAQPNIIFILADDLGWSDFSHQGSKYYETPNIDRMAKKGLRFTDAYTSAPNCAPTRACLMTGRYTPRHGIYTVGSGARGLAKFRRLTPVENRTQLPLSEQTLAEILKASGYTTGMFGKWHLGNGKELHPSQRGFDQAIVSNGKHFNFKTNPKAKVKKGEYLADFLTDKALDFIEQNKQGPFFLYLAHFAVHTPLQAKKQLKNHFAAKTGSNGHDNPTYAAMIASVDQSVGRVLDKLAELGIEENTVVIFSSDNGGVGSYNAAGVDARDITNNAPLKSGKGSLYEGGVRVAFIVYWRGTIQPGSRCGEPVISVDLLPTFADLAGNKAKTKNPIDGVSLVSLFTSSGKAKLKRDAIFWHFPGYLQGNVAKGAWRTTPAGSVRMGDWKLIEFFEDNRVELYNLKSDLSQKQNLADKMPAKAKELRDRLHQWRKDINAPMPKAKTGVHYGNAFGSAPVRKRSFEVGQTSEAFETSEVDRAPEFRMVK